ncbi:hypothetical protein CVT24_012364 [Panaeolus cyanescens]|uniref:Uncharacterized protein n=1 Tax=Panaeolus cyanescens TaxID=181874 RepID=A0A409X4E3_9AGAR|nr:hypothetical protein CVT24_012364 [Panaeolus cyanescens]
MSESAKISEILLSILLPEISAAYSDEENDEDAEVEVASDTSEEQGVAPVHEGDGSLDNSKSGAEEAEDVEDVEEDSPSAIGFQRRSTQGKRARFNAYGPQKDYMVFKAVLHTLHAMDEAGIDLAIFLDALSWGNQYCIQNDQCRTQRSMLLHSEELETILQRWEKPPRKKRPIGGSRTIEPFTRNLVQQEVEDDLKSIGPLLSLKHGDDVDWIKMTVKGIDELVAQAKKRCPTLWALLAKSAKMVSNDELKKRTNHIRQNDLVRAS